MKLYYLSLIVASLLIGALVLFYFLKARRTKQARAEYIRNYVFPAALRGKLVFEYPQLDTHQVDQTLRALKQFFLVCLEANAARGKMGSKNSVGMPSKLVDTAWHEFILMTRDYSRFCDKAFGAYLHHTPGEQMRSSLVRSLAHTLHRLRAIRHQPVGRAMIDEVPLLFAIDKAYAIPNGYYYGQTEIDALERKRQHTYMAGSSSGCGSGGGSTWDLCDFSWGGLGSSSSEGCGDGSGGGSCGGGGCGS
jgi:hypothetical protein